MFSYIRGTVILKSANFIVLENNGIGYEFICSTNTSSNLEQGKEACLFTFFQVKEDGVCLFGFETDEEKQLFIKLISVSGVGGKTAIQILSSATISDLAFSIMQGDPSILKRVKGIGKKTAELICVHLREQIGDIDIADTGIVAVQEKPVTKQVVEDAIEALTGLGLKKVDALKIVRKNFTGTETTEELIAKALKNMN